MADTSRKLFNEYLPGSEAWPGAQLKDGSKAGLDTGQKAGQEAGLDTGQKEGQKTGRKAGQKAGLDTGQKTGQELPVRSELLPGSSRYPTRLLELKDIPMKLYVLGEVELLNSLSLAIVGARKSTTYGLECAERFARRAADRGITVVSGGAIGCDMAAHRGALNAGGKTVVVLGSGADVVYPLRARGLFREVLEAGGALVSEAPWGSAPLSWAFSKRNRIIAALAEATLIVEAGLPSGTFQTADHTLALGNEVLVVPGPIFSNTCRGTNRLLLQGAIPIVDDESFDDTLSRIFGPVQLRSFSAAGLSINTMQQEDTCLNPEKGNSDQGGDGLTPQEIRLRQITDHILADLSANPMTIDSLAQAYKKDTVEIIRIITSLEIQGMIERFRDGRYMTKIKRECKREIAASAASADQAKGGNGR